MATEFHGQVMGGQLRLQPGQSELRQRLLASMEGKRVIETIRREGKSKSWSQVKTHFGLAVEMIRQRMIELGWDVCGVAPNKDMIHEILTRACFGVGEMGATVRLRDQTRAQNIEAFENVRAWSATQLNLVIPDPDPNWRQQSEQGE
jgi:hypothetical protein